VRLRTHQSVRHRQSFAKRFATATRWPVGVALTSWRYMWRTTPIHRWEEVGSTEEDRPPALPASMDRDGVQHPADGAGPMVHRVYSTRIAGSPLSPQQLIARLGDDLDCVAPSEFATFQKVRGDKGRLAVDDEYVVRMAAPWDGPVRVAASTLTSFRMATLDGHLEAGQIDFRASSNEGWLDFTIESWARSGDVFSDLLFTHLRMGKEVQLHMWTSTLERVVELAGGRMSDGIRVVTRRVPASTGGGDGGGTGPQNRRARRRLAELARRPLNFDPDVDPSAPGGGWRVDDMVVALPAEPSGSPVEGGSWETAKDLMTAYQVADPQVVRATYREDAPLAGRDMLLQIRFAGLRFHAGVRVGDVYEETREVDGRQARVFGWSYSTLEGHFEQGRMHYEAWKWLDTGDVEFRVHALSRAAEDGPWITRLGFRLLGRSRQLRFYREVLKRMSRLTRGRLEYARTRGEASGSATLPRPTGV
jgi:uncharacterized protein (UPF0548 family)